MFKGRDHSSFQTISAIYAGCEQEAKLRYIERISGIVSRYRDRYKEEVGVPIRAV